MRNLLAGLAGLLVFLVVSPPATAQSSRPRVVVLQTQPVDLPKLGPLALLTSVVNGVESQDGEIVPYGQLGDSHPECVTPTCYADVAKSTGATHVLRIDATFAKSTFELQLHMWDAATGTVVSGEHQQCKLCVASDLLNAAQNQAVVLCTKRFQAQPVAMIPPARSGSTDPKTTPGADLRGAATPGAEPPAWRRVLPWVAVGVGVPLLASGITLVAINNNTVCEGGEPQPCAHAYDTASRGWTLAVAGGLVTAGGLAVFGFNLWHRGDSPVVSIGPGRVGIGGHF